MFSCQQDMKLYILLSSVLFSLLQSPALVFLPFPEHNSCHFFFLFLSTAEKLVVLTILSLGGLP
jgi:hypothetical protein